MFLFVDKVFTNHCINKRTYYFRANAYVTGRHNHYCEGDIGGYPIPQYRKKKWQIPKHRVENRQNTDTPFMIGHTYLIKLYPSHMFDFLWHICTKICTSNQTQTLWKMWEDLKLTGTTIGKSSYWMSYQFHYRLSVRNCVVIFLEKSKKFCDLC